MKLDLRLEACNHPLWFGQPGRRRSGGGPIVDQDLKQILIRQHDFIVDGVHCHGAECRIRIVNPSDGLQLRAVLRRGISGFDRSGARVLPLLERRHQNCFSVRRVNGGNRFAYFAACVGQRIYRNEPLASDHFCLRTFPRQKELRGGPK